MFKKLNRNKIPVIINCDTGIDDAVALMIAEKSEKLDIKLLITDVGNVDPKQSAQNCLNVLELISAKDIPVCYGDGKCFKVERERYVAHGSTGLGEYEFEKNNRRLLDGDAIDILYQTLNNSEQKITLVSLSPTTNIAKLLTKYPDAKEKIERIVYMAGSIEEYKRGEIPYAEFNVSCDPEAAEVVFESGIEIVIVPMEMGHSAYLDWQEVFKTKNENYVGAVLEVIYRSYKDRHVKNGIATHDGCAIAYLTNPEIFEIKPVYAKVKYYEKISTGVLTVDFTKKPNAITCVSMNIKKFKKLYFNCLKKCK